MKQVIIRDVFEKNIQQENNQKNTLSFLIEFTKIGKAKYLSHLNMVNVFSKVIRRSGVTLKYSQGFNPKPKLEFAHPLSLGIESKVEVLLISLSSEITPNELKRRLNNNVPSGINILRCNLVPSRQEKGKRKSLMSIYGGSSYFITSISNNIDLNFFNSMLNYNKDMEYKNLHISQCDEKLKLIVDNTGLKDGNLFFHIDKLIDRNKFNENYSVERSKLFSGNNRRSYFEVLIG